MPSHPRQLQTLASIFKVGFSEELRTTTHSAGSRQLKTYRVIWGAEFYVFKYTNSSRCRNLVENNHAVDIPRCPLPVRRHDSSVVAEAIMALSLYSFVISQRAHS